MKKLLSLTALGFAALLSLTGCSSSEPVGPASSAESTTLRVYEVELPGDRAVDCVGSKFSGNIIMPDCNWSATYAIEPSAELSSATLRSYSVELSDGGSVLCVGSTYSSNAVAPDCDWDREAEAQR